MFCFVLFFVFNMMGSRMAATKDHFGVDQLLSRDWEVELMVLMGPSALQFERSLPVGHVLLGFPLGRVDQGVAQPGSSHGTEGQAEGEWVKGCWRDRTRDLVACYKWDMFGYMWMLVGND